MHRENVAEWQWKKNRTRCVIVWSYDLQVSMAWSKFAEYILERVSKSFVSLINYVGTGVPTKGT